MPESLPTEGEMVSAELEKGPGVWADRIWGLYWKCNQGTHCTGKTGKWPKKVPVRDNTGNLESLPKHEENTGNFICSCCNFLGSNGKEYCDICHNNFHVFF